MVTHYTDKQLEIEKLLNQMGFMTELEKVFGEFCVDIWIPDHNWVVEIDGPQHYEKKTRKRDLELLKMGVKKITHLESSISKSRAKEILQIQVGEID